MLLLGFYSGRYYGTDVLRDEVVVCDYDGRGYREPAAC